VTLGIKMKEDFLLNECALNQRPVQISLRRRLACIVGALQLRNSSKIMVHDVFEKYICPRHPIVPIKLYACLT